MSTPIRLSEQYVVDATGKKMGVILSLRDYERLLEDLHDLAIVAERREEQPISLEEMKRRGFVVNPEKIPSIKLC